MEKEPLKRLVRNEPVIYIKRCPSSGSAFFLGGMWQISVRTFAVSAHDHYGEENTNTSRVVHQALSNKNRKREDKRAIFAAQVRTTYVNVEV